MAIGFGREDALEQLYGHITNIIGGVIASSSGGSVAPEEGAPAPAGEGCNVCAAEADKLRNMKKNRFLRRKNA